MAGAKSKTKSQLDNKPTAEESFVSEQLSRPVLFHYFDGKLRRHGDAAALFRKLHYFPRLPLTNPTFWEKFEQRTEPATSEAVIAIAEIFGLHRLDDTTGVGLTDDQVIDLFAQFMELMFDEKKNPSGGWMLPQTFLAQCRANFQASTLADSGSASCSTATESSGNDSSDLPKSSPTTSARRSRQSSSRRSKAAKKVRSSTTKSTANPGR